MKKLKLHNESFRQLVASFREWLDVLGYAESTVYYLPNHLQEFFYYVEQQGIRKLGRDYHKGDKRLLRNPTTAGQRKTERGIEQGVPEQAPTGVEKVQGLSAPTREQPFYRPLESRAKPHRGKDQYTDPKPKSKNCLWRRVIATTMNITGFGTRPSWWYCTVAAYEGTKRYTSM